jgi:2-oxoglutarate/2-oxoacid ferredoxin oxidoreductase subunit alpha
MTAVTADRRLMEGSEAMAEAAIAAGCRFFAGYPMTPFTELLEHFARRLPEVGGVCINAESELEAVGMAWGALATGARAATGSTGQGLSLMQESFSEISLAELPLVIFNMARGQQDYFQATRGGGHGDYRHLVLAPLDIAEAVELTQLAFHLADEWRNPVLVYGDYLLAHTNESVSVGRVDFGELPPKDWAVDGSLAGTGRSRSISPLGIGKHGHEGPGIERHLRQVTAKLAEIERAEVRVETAHVDDAETVIIAFGTPAKFVRYVVQQLRADGEKVGYVRPITLWPYPHEAVRQAAERGRTVGVFELCAGQMIDDVRLGVLGRAPVVPLGGISTDGSGFGVGPLLDAEIIRDRILALHRGGADAELPPLPVNERG